METMNELLEDELRDLCSAEHMGLSDAVSLLQETLEEESAADQKLTEISLNDVLPRIPTNDGGGNSGNGR